jgi:hypothetical protein
MAGDVMTTDIVVGRGRGRGRGAALQRPATPAAPVASSALVSGAGDGHVNGLYTPRGSFNGRAYFNLEGADDDPQLSSIFWSGSEWIITLSDGDVSYNNDGEDVANPWDSAVWNTVDGIEPAPTVTEA